jgi:Zn-dependent M28 family amino/carboxypeptidase
VPRAPRLLLALAALTALTALAALAACGGASSAPARDRAAPTQLAAPAPAPAPDPMSETSLAADLAWLTAPERAGRGSLTAEARATARWIADELRAAGYAPIEQPIPSAPGQVNVIAEHAPTAPSDRASVRASVRTSDRAPAVIVVAHYDHLGVIHGTAHPGADDNASGVAVALAVARDLRRRPSSGRISETFPGRVVWLFTGAEEIGLRGARAFTAAPTLPLDEVRAVYNLDMVGRIPAPDGAPQLVAVGLHGDDAIADAAHGAADEAGLALIPVRLGLLTATGQAHRSDDWVFRDAGVRAVHFSTGPHDDYHSPRDTLDRVSRPQVARSARFLRALLERTAR